MSRKKVYAAIEAERAHQDSRWGTIQDYPHAVGEWLLILRTELREAEEAWARGVGYNEAVSEIVQLAAVAVACLEQHGIHGWSNELANRVRRANKRDE